jgi:hypothetical protein
MSRPGARQSAARRRVEDAACGAGEAGAKDGGELALSSSASDATVTISSPWLGLCSRATATRVAVTTTYPDGTFIREASPALIAHLKLG